MEVAAQKEEALNWIDRALMKLVPFFVITGDTGPYMVRYKLFRLPFFKIYIHHILRSDEDEELHCHPWNFVSFILWSGYIEVLPGGARLIRAWDIIKHRATDAHRLILDRPAWTLVFVTGKKRVWGFHTKQGWMSYTDFLNQKYGVGQWQSF